MALVQAIVPCAKLCWQPPPASPHFCPAVAGPTAPAEPPSRTYSTPMAPGTRMAASAAAVAGAALAADPAVGVADVVGAGVADGVGAGVGFDVAGPVGAAVAAAVGLAVSEAGLGEAVADGLGWLVACRDA